MTAAVFLFHRDLRIVDNNGLREAATKYDSVLPLFVFTPEQVTDKNKVRSVNAIQFMIESLRDLEDAIAKQGGKLYVVYGDTIDCLKSIVAQTASEIKAVVETADYTPYAKQRSRALAEFCASKDLDYVSVHDSYLLEPGVLKNKSGKTFQKFTPFYNAALKESIPEPRRGPERVAWMKLTRRAAPGKGTRKLKSPSWETSLDAMAARFVPKPNPRIAVKGGRAEGLDLLKHLPKDYAKTHDIPSVMTSMLSAHNHFGTVSIREVHHAARNMPEFVRQLWWRDFYGHIMADFEGLYGVGPYEFQKKEWLEPLSKEKQAWFDAWCRGETGVRLIDAGMKQLLETGWMHNRVRLVVASWLTKDKHIHWRHGERFFARHLVDYDPAQNMMNWIWVASQLPFASAPFRKVGAEGTAKKYDPDETYVKTWIDT